MESVKKRKLNILLTGVAIFLAGAIISAGFILVRKSEPQKTFTPGKPLAVYKNPELTEFTNIILKPGTEYKINSSRTVVLDHTFHTSYQNIKRYTVAYEIVAGGRSYWFSPNVVMLHYRTEQAPAGFWRPTPVFGIDIRFLPWCLAGTALSLWLGWCAAVTGSGRRRLYSLLAMYMSIWFTGVLAIFYLNGFYLIYGGGDPQNFIGIASEWLKFNRPTVVMASAGTAILYIPFLLIMGDGNLLQLIFWFSIFTLVVGGGGIIFLTGLLSFRLSKSLKGIHYALIPMILFILTAWIIRLGAVADPKFVAKTLMVVKSSDPYSMTLYNKSLLMGWSAMSDTWAALFMLLGLYIVFAMRPSYRKYICLGLSLGFSICCRYSSVAILPVVFWADLWRLFAVKRSWKQKIGYYAVFGICGFLAFCPQLVDNIMVSGSLVPPRLTYGKHIGREWKNLFNMKLHTIKVGFNFFLQIHFKLFLGFMLLLYCTRRKWLGMTWWIWLMGPFGFYTMLDIFNTHSAVRYIIISFPAIFTCAGMYFSRIRGSKPNQEAILWLVLFMFLLAFYSPAYPDEMNFYGIPCWLNNLIPVMAVIAAWVGKALLGITWKHCLAFTVMVVLMMTGAWWIVYIALIVYPFWMIALLSIAKLNRSSLSSGKFPGETPA